MWNGWVWGIPLYLPATSLGSGSVFLGNPQNVSVWEMSVYSASNRLNLGMLDLHLPSNGGREAGGVDLKPKSLSCERALGAACPGGAATVPWGAVGTSPSLLDSSCSYPSVLTPGPQIPSLFFGVLLSKSAWFGKRLPLQHVTGNLFPGAVIWRKAERGTSSHSRARTQKVKYSCFRWQYKGVIYEKDWHRPKGLVGNMIITIKKTDYSPVANIQTFLQSVQTYKTLLL